MYPNVVQPRRGLPMPVKVLIAVLIVALSFGLGNILGRYQTANAENPQLAVDGENTDHASQVDFQQFWDVWNYISSVYYKQPVSDEDLFYGALKGLLSGLDDPYSVYFDPEEAKAFAESIEGSFEGIGAEIGIRDDRLVIVAPLPETPAERAGIQAGDYIVMIDGTETTGMTVEEAVTRIRGEGGTDVVLTIAREGAGELMDISITRDKIVIDSVKYEVSDDKIATISIYTFNRETNELFEKAVQDSLTQGAQGVILDMRSNPGGLLSSAIYVASAWTGGQPVVLEKTKDDTQIFRGTTQARLADIPTVVLVNRGSASGSEIVAGALQDYEFGVLVGEKTFGKGSVQDYQELSDGSAVKVTVAEWYTPEGRNINQEGIEPDITVEYTLEDANEERDPQKEKARELLLEQIK